MQGGPYDVKGFVLLIILGLVALVWLYMAARVITKAVLNTKKEDSNNAENKR